MSSLSPRRIYDEYLKKNLDRITATDLLTKIIENSPHYYVRKSGLEYFTVISVRNRRNYSFLENLLVSDNSDIVRGLAAKAIILRYPNKAYELIKWVLKNEKSNFCLLTIINSLKNSTAFKLKSLQKLAKFVIHEDKIYFPQTDGKSLNLNQKNIVDLNQIIGLKNLKKLISLSLQDNKIIKICGLEKLTNLEVLSLFNNSILRIGGLKELNLLRELFLQRNNICEISDLNKLPNLQKLYLSSNKIKRITGLEHNLNLKILSLYKNEIHQINGLDNLTKLEELYLSENKIVEIEGLDMLKELKRLDLSNNDIREIKGLEELTNLTYLNLYSNKIKKIKGLTELKNLQFLNLGSNEISRIEGLEELNNLEYLYLKNNPIEKISNLNTLKRLKVLNLNNTDISENYKSLKSLYQLKTVQELSFGNTPIAYSNLYKKQIQNLSGNMFHILDHIKTITRYREPISKVISKIEIKEKSLDFTTMAKDSDFNLHSIKYLSDTIIKVLRSDGKKEFFNVSKDGVIKRL
ncbi:MAG: hypothetical protein GF353_23050 [Candidatus Lokiarchaeota archaeon]|nr:hypothetical protein [Candidatus Lokiarchaeota archaeon]